MTGRSASGPWTVAHARAVGACDLAAALVVVAAGCLAGREDSLDAQIAWVNLAVLGLLGATVANGYLFLLARRAIGRRRLALVPDVAASVEETPVTGEAPRWWWLPGTTRAHLEGCPMIAGKAAKPISTARVRSKGLIRCELCR